MRKITLNILFFLVSLAALSAQQNPSITIVNNTGYTIWYVYISQTASDNWGSDRLGSGKTIPDGDSVSLQLPSPIDAENQYDIGLEDSNGDIYTKYNIQVSANARIVFTSDDYDNNLTKAAYSGPSITVVNNTGNKVLYVFMCPIHSDSWGRNKLGSGETIPDGGSISLQLPYLIGDVNRYHIGMEDSNGDTYKKYDVQVSANDRIVFTLNDFDND
jgi:hypothetical protein